MKARHHDEKIEIKSLKAKIKQNLEEVNKIAIESATKTNRTKFKLSLMTTECLNLLEYDLLEERLNENLELKWKHAASVLNRFFLFESIIYFIVTFSSIILPAVR